MKGSPTDASSEEEIRCVGFPEERSLVKEEESPYAGHPACVEYSCNNNDCSTEGDGISKVMAEDNERVDADREVALAVALDRREVRTSRRLVEDQFGRSRQHRADTVLVREL